MSQCRSPHSKLSKPYAESPLLKVSKIEDRHITPTYIAKESTMLANSST